MTQDNPYPLDEYLYRQQHIAGLKPTNRVGTCGDPRRSVIATYLRTLYDQDFWINDIRDPSCASYVSESDERQPLPAWAIQEEIHFDSIAFFGTPITKARYDIKMTRTCDACAVDSLITDLTPIAKHVDFATGIGVAYDWWCDVCMTIPREQQDETDANSEPMERIRG